MDVHSVRTALSFEPEPGDEVDLVGNQGDISDVCPDTSRSGCWHIELVALLNSRRGLGPGVVAPGEAASQHDEFVIVEHRQSPLLS